MREVVLNLLIHREYSNSYPASLTIWNDKIETENWNLPFQYGNITPENLRPHAKNPTIANVFSQAGLVEELGSGTRKIFKYTPFYANGKQAEITDEDVFRIVVPHDEGSGVVNDVQNGVVNDVQNGSSLLNEREMVVFAALCQNNHLSARELSEKTGAKHRTVQRYLAKFQKNGLIIRVGADKNGYWVVKKS